MLIYVFFVLTTLCSQFFTQIPMKLSGTCGSVSVRLIPAPRGTGLVAAPASKKILAMAGLEVRSTASTNF